MTRLFDQATGNMIPVTVIDVADNQITQVKTEEKDGYSAVQIGFDKQKDQRVAKPQAGHLKKGGAASVKLMREFRVEASEIPADVASYDGLATLGEGQWVDVVGTTKGKGFQGAVKRHHFSGSPDTHGSMMHRRTGAIGCRSTPGRVWKNQKMPGRHGNFQRTVQNLKVVQVRSEDKVILVSGSVPGAIGSYLVIRPAKKK